MLEISLTLPECDTQAGWGVEKKVNLREEIVDVIMNTNDQSLYF